jgi:hypothetical protein
MTRHQGFKPTRLVIGTSRTIGSAKKFVRITSGFGGQFADLSRLQFTSDESEFIPDYI